MSDGEQPGPRATRVPPPRWRISLAIAVAVLAVSFAAIFIRKAAPTHPLVIAASRLSIASAVLAVPVLRAYRGGRLPPKVLGAAAVGGLAYTLHFSCWIGSLSLTTVASAVTLVTATPLFLAVHGLATGRDRPTRRTWMSIGLAAVGIVVLAGTGLGSSLDALLGDALALVGAAAMAWYLLIVRPFGDELDVLSFSGVAVAVAAVLVWLLAWVAGAPLEVAEGTLGWIVLAALVPQLVGHTLITWSLRHTSPTTVGLATVAEPVGSTLLAWLWLSESLTLPIGLGAAIVLVAVTVALTE